jgi:hypothetical protein
MCVADRYPSREACGYPGHAPTRAGILALEGGEDIKEGIGYPEEARCLIGIGWRQLPDAPSTDD